jgi:hypothetical protein
MTQTVERKTELYLKLNDLFEEITQVRKTGSRGENVSENYDRWVTALMTIRDIAGELAELDSERAICMWVLEDSVTKEILRLTTIPEKKSAGVGAA